MLLILGYALLSIAVLFVCVCATDLYLAQKRLDAVADFAALAGADGFTLVVDGEGARAELTDAGVREQVDALWRVAPQEAEVIASDTPDGVSSRVTVAIDWAPPLLAPFVGDGVRLESTATSRTALQ